MRVTVAKTTPKDFFSWLGILVSFYASIISLVALLFYYVDYAFPDQLPSIYYGDPYSSGIRYAMASLVVFFPIFLALSALVRHSIKKDPTRQEVWIRRWTLYLTVFFASLAIAVDLVTLFNVFLAGEITIRFAIKVAFVILIAAAGFMHFLADIGGYWIAKPMLARYVAWAVSLLVVGTIISGFIIIGSPAQARLISLDNQKIQTLQQVESSIQYYWQHNNALPTQLSDVPSVSSGTSYAYKQIDARLFKLCAHFDATSPSYASDYEWYHGVGDTCFVRSAASWYAKPYAPIQKKIPEIRPQKN